MALIFLGFPLAIYLSLCLLPKGREGLGIGLAAAALALVWVTNDPATDGGFARLMVQIGAAAVALAALAQGLRRAIPAGAAGWIWPALMAGLAVSAVMIFLVLL